MANEFKVKNGLITTNIVASGTLTGSTAIMNIGAGQLYKDAAGNIGIGTATNSTYKLQVVGNFAATTKSFVIDHPTKDDMKLRYGSLESPYHGIRLTGEGTLVNGSCTIILPDYIHGLVSHEGAQVQITNIKHGQVIWVEDINIDQDNFVVMTKIKARDIKEYKFFWSFTAIRKDVDPMVVEFKEWL